MLTQSTETDTQLVLLIKEGNERAMSEIFDRYWHKLLAVALNRLDNLEDAEECVQDVFINLWKLRATLQLKYSLYTYLSAAVRYRVLDLMDKQYRKPKYAREELNDLLEISSDGAAPDSNILLNELLERIEASVKQLPEKCQIVYRMSREDGHSNKKIAEELNISEKTVEAHLTKAIKDIRDNLTVTLLVVMILFSDIYRKL
jgi:RNA polymerase sigma-70 factor (family 1)